MRFKEFLEEAKHREDISIEKALELIKTNCSDAWNYRKQPLFRGTQRAKEDAYLIQGDMGERASANTENYYTVTMDHFLPKKGYPKRSKSIILGNNANEHYATSYGGLYAIFPYNDVPIGVCDQHDIWHTMVTIGEKTDILMRWNETWKYLGLSDDSYEEFVQSIKTTMGRQGGVNKMELSKMFGSSANVEFELKSAYGSNGLKLNLATTKTIGRFEDRARELWIGGKCVAIKASIWEKLVKTL